jgi:DNA-binding NarL/FixJ family response regulator
MRRSVLVVDDHAGFRAFLAVYLGASGYLVVGEASDGAGAIREASRLRPDIVLLDVQLPDLDGFEVARQLVRSPAAPAVVMISSRDDPDLTVRAIASSTRGFVAKSNLSRATIEELLR